MNISIAPSEQTGITRRLQISVPPETVAVYEDKAARKYATKVRLPGFRPGKAPPTIVRKRFAEAIRQEAIELVINEAFRWVSLLRTGTINLALITLGHYLLGYLGTFPWLSRPVAGNPHLRIMVIFPPPVMVLLFFCSFLVSAWLGCLSPRHASELERAKS